MTRWTTPTFRLKFPDTVDLTQAEHVYVTISQGSESICKMEEDELVTVAEHSISVSLTQEESSRFAPTSPVKIKVNWTYLNGRKRCCTKTKIIHVDDNLERRVLP